MSDSVDRRSPVPLYRQIKQILLQEIQAGSEDSPERPITERELIDRFHVSRAPIRQALKELADEGYLYRQKAKGTFPVRGLQVSPPALQLGGLTEHLRQQNLSSDSKVLRAGWSSAPPAVQDHLKLREGDEAYQISRLIIVQDKPYVWSRLYLRMPTTFSPSEQEIDSVGAVFELLKRTPDLALVRGEHTIYATKATAEDARVLAVRTGAPVLVTETLMFTRQGLVRGWRKLVHRSPEYKFVFTVSR